MTCPHMNFRADVKVARLEDRPGAGAKGFMAEVRIRCHDCGTEFQFLGLEPGIDTHGARCSIDGLEALIAIVPKGSVPSPLQRISFNVGKFDA